MLLQDFFQSLGQQVEITYDLLEQDGDLMTVSLQVSSDGRLVFATGIPARILVCQMTKRMLSVIRVANRRKVKQFPITWCQATYEIGKDGVIA